MDHPDYQDYVGKEQGEKDMWQQVRHTASLRARVAYVLKWAVRDVAAGASYCLFKSTCRICP
jgi:hypothetical protein